MSISCGMTLLSLNRVYSPNERLDMLRVITVSKAQANQRTGRAGRDGPGLCYRLYTEDQFDNMLDNAEPEIKRSVHLNVIGA